jgi:hypothetical protein
MINRISPFIVEVALGILIGFIIGYFLNLELVYEWLTKNDGKVLSIYAILITVSAGFTGLIFSESDKDFVKFLIKENADKWYRTASIFNLGFFILGTISTLLIPTFEQINAVLWLTLCIIGINSVQVYSTLILILNYTDLKRKFQHVR